MPQGRLILLFTLLAAGLPLAAQLPRGGDLGKRWKAKEWTPAYNLQGTWVRRGASNEFDVSYSDAKTRQDLYWRVVIIAVDGAQVRMKATIVADGGQKTYDVAGRLLGDGRTIRGRGGWCAPTQSYCGFEVVTDWSVAAKEYTQFSRPGPLRGRDTSAPVTAPEPSATPAPRLKDLPPHWRVKDNSIPGFAYQGDWIIRGRELRFTYTSPASGDKADGFMLVEVWDGTMVGIRNRAAKRYYEGLLQPGGNTLRGVTRPCPPKQSCTWEATLEK